MAIVIIMVMEDTVLMHRPIFLCIGLGTRAITFAAREIWLRLALSSRMALAEYSTFA